VIKIYFILYNVLKEATTVNKIIIFSHRTFMIITSESTIIFGLNHVILNQIQILSLVCKLRNDRIIILQE
jgi:hypothetical protein